MLILISQHKYIASCFIITVNYVSVGTFEGRLWEQVVSSGEDCSRHSVSTKGGKYPH